MVEKFMRKPNDAMMVKGHFNTVMHGALVLCKVIQKESTTGLNPAVRFGRAMYFYLTDTAAEIGGVIP
jgi:hypothetical protein